MKFILGNHWASAPNEEWNVLKQEDQDMTHKLKWEGDSVDVIFTEHCQEHITLIENIGFFKEVLRVLKVGGVLRVALPTIDKLIQFKNDELGQQYANVQLKHYYVAQDIALRELGLNGINEEPIAFMFDSLLKGHNHKFLWTSELLKKTLQKIGFSEVYICNPGETNFNKEDCLERTIRGVDPDKVLKDFNITEYDCETSIIEAKK